MDDPRLADMLMQDDAVIVGEAAQRALDLLDWQRQILSNLATGRDAARGKKGCDVVVMGPQPLG
jgi:hypothetical protein